MLTKSEIDQAALELTHTGYMSEHTHLVLNQFGQYGNLFMVEIDGVDNLFLAALEDAPNGTANHVACRKRGDLEAVTLVLQPHILRVFQLQNLKKFHPRERFRDWVGNWFTYGSAILQC